MVCKYYFIIFSLNAQFFKYVTVHEDVPRSSHKFGARGPYVFKFAAPCRPLNFSFGAPVAQAQVRRENLRHLASKRELLLMHSRLTDLLKVICPSGSGSGR